jgi:hypothetical protein
MAKIVEEIIGLRLSKLVKDSEPEELRLIDDEIMEQIEEALINFVPAGVVVEVVGADE